MKVAFIGLGVMGYPMAGHLQAAGYDVCVYNRTTAKAKAWQEQHGGRMAETPKAAAQDADIVMTCVGNDDDLHQVCLGEDGCYHALKPGAVHIDHTTTSAQIAVKLAEAAKSYGAEFMDGPVSGGQAGAENGQLTVMLGGNQDTFDKCEPVMQAFSKSMTLIGDVGAGQKAKMANQICIAGVVQGLAEAVHFMKSADLDVEKVIAAISKGAAQSWQMENRYQTMMQDEYDFGFAVDWMRKDLGIALQEANNVGAQLPVTALVDQFYADVQAIGGSRWDTSSLHARLKQRK